MREYSLPIWKYIGLMALVFSIVVGIMWKLIPHPRRDVDYLVIGATATIVSLGALFILLISTIYRRPDVFFRKRKP